MATKANASKAFLSSHREKLHNGIVTEAGLVLQAGTSSSLTIGFNSLQIYGQSNVPHFNPPDTSRVRLMSVTIDDETTNFRDSKFCVFWTAGIAHVMN